jgi:hypothetical protein
VDPAGRRAFVVAPGGPVAEVGLADLRVAYHRLDRPASLLQRLGSWLLPPAEAKAVSGGWRQARWVGGGLLAVAGGRHLVERDKQGDLRQRDLPSGVDLIDTRRWVAHPLHAGASSVGYEGGRLLLYGGAWRSEAPVPAGVGLTVYGPGDRRPFHLLGRRPVEDVHVRGDWAYVTLIGANAISWAVIDLRTGRTLHRETGDPLLLLLGDGSDWW